MIGFQQKELTVFLTVIYSDIQKEKEDNDKEVEEKRTLEEAKGDPNVGKKRTFQMLFGKNDSGSEEYV